MRIINLIKCEFIKNYNFKKNLIIGIILLISVIVITEFNVLLKKEGSYPIASELNYANDEYNIRNTDISNLTLKQDFNLNSVKNRIAMLKKMKKIGNIKQSSWQCDVLFDIFTLQNHVFVINQIIDNPSDSTLFDIYNYEGIQYEEFEGIVKEYYSIASDDLKKLIVEKEEKINKLESLINDNKYYKYIQYLLDNDMIYNDSIKYYQIMKDSKLDDSINYYQKIVDEKIETENNYLVRYLYQKNQINSNILQGIATEKEYNIDEYYTAVFKDYNSYLRYTNIFQKLSKEKFSIINYAIKNNIKHDINFTEVDYIDNDKYYMNTKIAVNQILNLSVVVIILIAITCGGIVSNEHIKGTEKLLLTSPIKRWKVLLGKFIYVILHSYIIWFATLFILSIYAGFRFGFNDLFTPKLIYSSGSVIEVNYFLYMVKDIFVCSIPVICFISIMFFLSTVTLNTSLTIGITTILGCVSPILWYVISTFKLSFLAYTPFPYFDFALVKNMNVFYFDTLKFTNINMNTGLIICIIVTIIIYLITTIIYCNRDIKN